MNYLKHLLLVFLSCMLFSCAGDESEKLVPNEMFGDFVVLRLGFDGIAENKPGGTTKSTDDLLPSPQTFVEKIGDDLLIETTISPVYESDNVQTKGQPSGLGSSAILAIVYDLSNGGKLYKCQTFKANDAKVYLPQGHEFKIVFYSYNSDKVPDINNFLESGDIMDDGTGSGYLFTSDAKLGPFNESNGTNVVWCMIQNTGKITTATKLPNMLFIPVFTRLEWVLNSDKGAISGLDCSIQNTYARASVRINDLHASGADMYNVWTPVGTPDQSTPLAFSAQNAASVASDKKVFIVDETKGTSLKINSISIDGFAGSSKEINVGRLERGYSYRVVSRVLSGVAAPRIFVSGSGDAAVLQLTKSPSNYGSFFQFGSVIAWSSRDPLTQDFNPASGVSSSWNSAWSVGASFPAHTAANLRAGKGDPCRLVGYSLGYIKSEIAKGNAPDNKTWRMPDKDENKTFGSNYSNLASVSGVSGRYFGPGATLTGTGGEFLPSNGFRLYGTLHYSSNGFYWSTSGSGLSFTSESVNPELTYTQAHAFGVRCISQ